MSPLHTSLSPMVPTVIKDGRNITFESLIAISNLTTDTSTLNLNGQLALSATVDIILLVPLGSTSYLRDSVIKSRHYRFVQLYSFSTISLACHVRTTFPLALFPSYFDEPWTLFHNLRFNLTQSVSDGSFIIEFRRQLLLRGEKLGKIVTIMFGNVTSVNLNILELPESAPTTMSSDMSVIPPTLVIGIAAAIMIAILLFAAFNYKYLSNQRSKQKILDCILSRYSSIRFVHPAVMRSAEPNSFSFPCELYDKDCIHEIVGDKKSSGMSWINRFETVSSFNSRDRVLTSNNSANENSSSKFQSWTETSPFHKACGTSQYCEDFDYIGAYEPAIDVELLGTLSTQTSGFEVDTLKHLGNSTTKFQSLGSANTLENSNDAYIDNENADVPQYDILFSNSRNKSSISRDDPPSPSMLTESKSIKSSTQNVQSISRDMIGVAGIPWMEDFCYEDVYKQTALISVDGAAFKMFARNMKNHCNKDIRDAISSKKNFYAHKSDDSLPLVDIVSIDTFHATIEHDAEESSLTTTSDQRIQYPVSQSENNSSNTKQKSHRESVSEISSELDNISRKNFFGVKSTTEGVPKSYYFSTGLTNKHRNIENKMTTSHYSNTSASNEGGISNKSNDVIVNFADTYSPKNMEDYFIESPFRKFVSKSREKNDPVFNKSLDFPAETKKLPENKACFSVSHESAEGSSRDRLKWAGGFEHNNRKQLSSLPRRLNARRIDIGIPIQEKDIRKLDLSGSDSRRNSLEEAAVDTVFTHRSIFSHNSSEEFEYFMRLPLPSSNPIDSTKIKGEVSLRRPLSPPSSPIVTTELCCGSQLQLSLSPPSSPIDTGKLSSGSHLQLLSSPRDGKINVAESENNLDTLYEDNKNIVFNHDSIFSNRTREEFEFNMPQLWRSGSQASPLDTTKLKNRSLLWPPLSPSSPIETAKLSSRSPLRSPLSPSSPIETGRLRSRLELQLLSSPLSSRMVGKINVLENEFNLDT